MNTVIDYFRLYETNTEFKEYVDAFCRTHMKSIEEVLQYQVIKEFANYLLQKD